MQDYEKLGVFYLGKLVNPSTGKLSEEPLLYDSKNFTTHAVCVGMTGSGKTGLGIAILEEAAIDGIPAIIIDPKGDLGNLMLTFPTLSPSNFLPWIDSAEAQRKGLSPQAYAEAVAKTWKDGLASWGEDPERIKRLRDAVDIEIYTPANRAGVPVSILSSFAAPSKELMLDSGALRDRVLSLTSSVLGLLGISADPIKSREHILISSIIDQAWKQGKNLDIAALIQQVQKPPFSKIGALDVETFFPTKERMALSISLNNLLASPGFQAWMEGEPLDIQDLLFSKEGKPKLSIISIAHLSDSERMFFVTLLLNEMVSWMRRQPGTSSLRALLYMDEIFGYFPPSAMPPSKTPMLMLLKQARAFGLGIVLCTQNPVDLDYKGLANCGTWFIGKLQTERDKKRVLEGLQEASNGEIDARSLDKMLTVIGSRIFLMRSIYEKDPILFQTRWTMAYLRGPLTLMQIDQLVSPEKKKEMGSIQLQDSSSVVLQSKPVVVPEVAEYYEHSTALLSKAYYEPFVVGMAKLHFVDSKNQVDTWREVCLFAAASDDGMKVMWEQGKNLPQMKSQLDKQPLPDSTFAELPAGLMQKKNFPALEKDFGSYLYQSQTFKIYKSSTLGIVSKDNETEEEFRARVQVATREKRDEVVQKVRDKYAAKVVALNEKLRRAQEKVSQQQSQEGRQKTDALISFGTTLLGALFGRGITKGTISQAGTSIKRVGKISKESQEVSAAEDNVKAYQQQLVDLNSQIQEEIDRALASGENKIEEITIRPRKGDVTVEQIAIVWCQG